MPGTTVLPGRHDLQSILPQTWVALLLLPCLNLVSVLVLRDHAGPFWMWSNLDPDYWYLFDSLNMANLNWPGTYHHPGTPLQVLGALVIKAAHPLASGAQLTDIVLTNPERYLHLIHACLVVLNTLALGFAGLCGYLLFRDLVPVLLLQMGPFISTLCIKWMTHVSPEPLLITVVLVLASLALLAIRPGQLEANKTRYAVLFGLLAGFGMATKITSIGIYFLPLFLLGNIRSLALYGGTAALSMVFFTLPAAGIYGDMIGHINNISVGSTEIGVAKKPFIDLAQYPSELLRVSSRPVFFIVLLTGLSTVGYLLFQSRRHNTDFPVAGKLLAGLCLGDIVQALIVAKHPSGHYMIPVLTLSTLGMALLYQIWRDQRRRQGTGGRLLKTVFLLLLIGLFGAQTTAGLKLDRQFQSRVAVASQHEDQRFDSCARIYFWAAATPSYALQMGDFMTKNRFTSPLGQLRPANDFWFEVEAKEFRDWNGPYPLAEIIAAYPCIYARGAYPGLIRPTLKRLLPDRTFSDACSTPARHETVLTSGVDCQGNLQPEDGQ